jgi:thiol-disulfide isomerase/thioredoxin
MRLISALILSAAILVVAVRIPDAAALTSIYPDPAHAKTDLAAALQAAPARHRRIILDFGGDWCPDCHAPLLEAGFILVHVNIGHMDQNLDIAERYQIPLNKGVPALAVLDSDGTLLFSQRAGEFEAMRRMESSKVTEFLKQWKQVPPR